MKKIHILLIFFIATLSNCEKANQVCDKFPDPPEGLVQWNIISVEGPSTSLVNQTITLVVTYPTSSGCDYVSEFVTVTCIGNKIRVKAYGNTTHDTPCTQASIPKTINFEFTQEVKGQFVLEFLNEDNSVISHTITFN